MYPPTAPRGHRAPPDEDLDDTDDQHEGSRDERSDCPTAACTSTGKRWEQCDRNGCGNNRKPSAHCADLCQPQMRRHPSGDCRLSGCPVCNDRPRRVLILAHGWQHKTEFDCSTRCARSARIALGGRLLRRHSGTKGVSPRFSSARRRAIRLLLRRPRAKRTLAS
jgi:hypothetical protein